METTEMDSYTELACCMDLNEPSNEGTLTALAVAGLAFYRPTSSLNGCLILQKVE